jgi:hypothetical protein
VSPSRHPHLWRQAFRANLKTGRQRSCGRVGPARLAGARWSSSRRAERERTRVGLLASVFSVGLVAWFGLQVAPAARTTARRGVIANAIAVLANAVITYKVIHSGVRDAPYAKRSDR